MRHSRRETRTASPRTLLGAALLGGALACAALPAQAARHALLMGIAHYTDPTGDLPGIDLDLVAARRIASAMGVPPSNITERKDAQLTYDGLGKALRELTDRIQPGDQVLITYSGHGGQTPNVSGSDKKCSEGIVAHDVRLYYDRELEADLTRLGTKASQVVMMNDSCFSGGASTKEFTRLKPKFFPGQLRKAGGAPVSAPECGQAVNKGLAKSFEVIPRAGANLLYIAAAADNEVSYASESGSLASQAWAACIVDTTADTDRSGFINGEELRVCAQARIDANPLKVTQHVTLTGSKDLPISSVGAMPPVAGPAGSTPGPLPSAAAAVVPAQALQDLRAGGSKDYAVTLVPPAEPLKIGSDSLQFDVVTPREGYVYIYQVGTSGTATTLLFPNAIDGQNRLPAGRHTFPRPGWSLKSTGPAGTNHLMVLLADEKRDYSQISKRAGPFATMAATRAITKDFVVVSSGTGPRQKGRYGTSEVVPVVEVP